MVERKWHVDPVLIELIREPVVEEGGDDVDPFSTGENPVVGEKKVERERFLVDILKDCGIDFPEKSSVRYDPETKLLVSKNSLDNLDLIGRLLEGCALQVSREQALGTGKTEPSPPAHLPVR